MPSSDKAEDAKDWYPKEGKVDMVGFSYHSTDASEDGLSKKVAPFYELFGKDKPFVLGPVDFTPSAESKKPVEDKMNFLKQLTSKDMVTKFPTYGKTGLYGWWVGLTILPAVAAIYNNAKTKDGDARIIYTEAEADGVEKAAEMNKQVRQSRWPLR